MPARFLPLVFSLLTFLGAQRTVAQNEPGKLGVFEAESDVGVLTQPGRLVFDAGQLTYTIAASGENVWFDKDYFHFVWMKVSGDGYLEADIVFPEADLTANPHRKALLMARTSLDADSPYADIALHGNGLTSLQFRDEKGSVTREVQAARSAPRRLRIVKHGDYFTMWLASEGGSFEFAGSSPRIALGNPFYVGLGVCSHEKDKSTTAVFSNVKISGSAETD